MRVLIVDDEALSHESLTALLRLTHPDTQIVGQAYTIQEGLQLLQQVKPDVVFLDIQLPDGTGFDLLNQLGRKQTFVVVFITAHDHHAVRAFNFSAIDFVLKPFNTKKLKSAVQKARERLKEQSMMVYLNEIKETLFQWQQGQLADRIMISNKEGVSFVPLTDIIRFESANDKVTVYCQHGENLEVSKRLTDFESRLQHHPQFVRVHRSYLVNIRYANKLEGNILRLNDNTNIPVSYKEYMPKLKERLKTIFE